MAAVVNANDPRVKRTRQLLIQAFVELLTEKQTIHAVSVNEIAERATVNWATFYAHFEDKYALFEAWIREQFQQIFQKHLPEPSTLQIDTLRLLIGSVFNTRSVRYYLERTDKQLELIIAIALQEEVYNVIYKWLVQLPCDHPTDMPMVEIAAQSASWVICGTSAQWSRGDRSVPADEMTQRVLNIVIASLSPLIMLHE